MQIKISQPRNVFFLLYALGVFLSAYSLSILAKDLGVVGRVYPIIETDFVTMAQKKIQDQNQMKSILQSLQKNADRPDPVFGLQPTLHSRQWFFNPSFRVPKDVGAVDGHILLKSGVSFNPLSVVHLKNALIFFDGDDSKQIAWVKEQNRALKGRILLILVNGSIHGVSLHFSQKQVYFDQGGRLTTRLQITHVPAIVKQAGFQLEIREVVP